MTRTFTILAVLVTLLMLATIGVGFVSFFQERRTPGQESAFLLHFYLGLGTALGVLLIHCIIFTYFLGTGRWVKEVALAYKLPDEPLPKTTRELKRKTFPPALFSMLIVIAASASGAGVQLQAWTWHVHATLAFLTVLINLWAFKIEYESLELNGRILAAVLDEVDKLRQAQGLPTIEEELAKGQS